MRRQVKETALHYATEAGHREAVRMLLAYGAKANARNRVMRLLLSVAVLAFHRFLHFQMGYTPLHYAHSSDIARTLCVAGADETVRTKVSVFYCMYSYFLCLVILFE